MNFQDLDLVVLKGVLSNKKNGLEFAYENNEKLFSSDLWRFVKLVLEHIRVYREIPTRRIMIEKSKASKNEALTSYILSMWDVLEKVNCDEKEFKHDLENLKNRFAEKLIYNLKDNLVNEEGRVDLKKSVSELTTTVNHIKSINQVKAYEQKTLKESLEDFRTKYVAKMDNPNIGVGLKTGYGFLDFALGGLRPTEMLLIGAETGMGKSLLMMNMGINMWLGENSFDMNKDFKQGNDVLYFSLEMPYHDMLERILACIAKIPQTSIRDATLTDVEKKKLSGALKFIECYPYDFTIVDIPRGATMDSIELIYNDVCATRGKKPRVVIVDYLALLSHNQKDISDWLQLNYLSEALHEFGRVNDVICITATQLNRPPNTKSAESMGVHRLSRSALQAANANFVLLIDKRQNEQELPTMQLHLVKSRRTPLVSGTIYKQLSYCALLNEPLESYNNTQSDIVDLVE